MKKRVFLCGMLFSGLFGVSQVFAISNVNDLVAEVLSCSDVKLTWTDILGETAYRIRRKKVNETSFQNLEDVEANSTSFIDKKIKNKMCRPSSYPHH